VRLGSYKLPKKVYMKLTLVIYYLVATSKIIVLSRDLTFLTIEAIHH